jgi:serine/threonine protein kinase
MADDRVLEMLVEWEERRRQGQPATAEQLCPDDAELQEALRQRIRKRERLGPALDLPGETLAEAARPAAGMPVLEGFEMLGVLGRGGMGVVYKARETALKRLVAVKMILAGAGASGVDRERFRAEAEAGARLQHSNIVQTYAVGVHDGCPYLVLELVEGGSLAQALNGRPLPPRRAAELALALAEAVDYAHRQGVVHRDLKPANVLLESSGVRGQGSAEEAKRPGGNSLTPDPRPLTPKIADFGLAKRLDVAGGYTHTGAVLGSPSYMAPEQAEGRARMVGAACDVYALGAILYEMLTGRPPFAADTILETLEQVRYKDPLPPTQLQARVPRDLEAICLKCLEKKPAHRYASAAALAADLRRFLDNEAVQARSVTLLGQVVRTISHSGIDANFHPWGNVVLPLAPVPLLANVAAFLLLRGSDVYYQAMVLLSLSLAAGLTTLIFGSNRRTMRDVSRRQRRHLISVWVAHLASMSLVPVIVWRLLPPREPADLFIVYPLWAVLAAVTFCAMAAEAGYVYLIGGACYVVAGLMLLEPEWSPFLVGLIMTGNLTLQGLFLRSLRPR